MNWIDIVWPMMGAASLTLALIHLLVWFKQGHQTAHLMFAVTGVSVGGAGDLRTADDDRADAESLRRSAALGARAVRGDDDRHRRLRPPESAGRQALARRARLRDTPGLPGARFSQRRESQLHRDHIASPGPGLGRRIRGGAGWRAESLDGAGTSHASCCCWCFWSMRSCPAFGARPGSTGAGSY